MMEIQTTAQTRKILSKLPDYPYDLFCDVNDDGIVSCLIDGCDKRFRNYDKYLEHYIYNNSHTSFIKRNLMMLRPQHDLGEEIVWDPIEKKQIEYNILHNPDYAALRYNTDATDILEDKIKFSVKYNRNVIFEIIGVPGAGKSYAGIAIAYTIAGRWANKLKNPTTVDLDFEQTKILEMIKERERGDVLIQDEDPRGFGSGVNTNEEAFENLAKTLRKRGISFVMISPVETRVKNVNFVIEFFAYYPNSRITKGVLYTRKKLALGYVYIEILDEVDYIEYEKMKDAFIDKMQFSGGFGVDNYDEQKLEDDFQALLKRVIEDDPNMKMKSVLGRAAIIVKGNMRYQEMVASDVYYYLKRNPMGEEKKTVTGSGGLGSHKLSWKLLDSIEDDALGDVIYEYSVTSDRQQELGKAWWKHYFCGDDAKGEQAADFINEEFNESASKQAYYNTFFPAFTKDEDCFGKAVEKAVNTRYYPDYRLDGGTGKPDLIGKDDYIEVKARKKGTTRDIYGYFKDSSYIWDMLEKGEDVKLVELEYAPKRKFIINVYQLYIDKDNTTDNESSKGSG